MQRVGERYGRVDLAGPWDAIVIGSGMGGLATASLLACHGGRRVLVLERHYMPGGFTHAYRRHGYEWDVGLHYIGEVHREGSPTRRLYDHVTGGRVRWHPMGEVYDRIVIQDRAYDLRAGREAFREGLREHFPLRMDAVDRYIELIDRVPRTMRSYLAEKAVPPLVAALAGRWMRRPMLRWARCTTREVLERLTDDRELIAVLTGQWGDYGLPPGESSFLMHAAVARHYLEGGAYPVGGASALAAGVAPSIEAAGGRIVYQAEVERILVDRGTRVLGVGMADGTEIHAPLVVSAAGVHNTFLRLLDGATRARHGLGSRSRAIRPSVAHLCLYAGFRRSAAELGLETTNLWLYPGPDHDASVRRFLADTCQPLPLVYASFPSAKDPSFEDRYPGRATVELITLASFEEFDRWSGTEWRRRGDPYETLKRRYAERLIERVSSRLPGLFDQVDYYEVSTPLTTRHFANYERGEIYGLDHSPRRFEARWLRPRTPIGGLFLTGQDIVTAGVTPALISGYLTSSAILRRNLMKAGLES